MPFSLSFFSLRSSLQWSLIIEVYWNVVPVTRGAFFSLPCSTLFQRTSRAVRCFYRAGAGNFTTVRRRVQSVLFRFYRYAKPCNSCNYRQDCRRLRRVYTGATPSARDNDVQRPCYLPRDRSCIIASYPLPSTVIEPAVGFVVSVPKCKHRQPVPQPPRACFRAIATSRTRRLAGFPERRE